MNQSLMKFFKMSQFNQVSLTVSSDVIKSLDLYCPMWQLLATRGYRELELRCAGTVKYIPNFKDFILEKRMQNTVIIFLHWS